MRQGPHDEIIGFEIVRALHPGPLDLGLAHRRINRTRHHFRNAVLKVEQVGRGALRLAGPDMAGGIGFNELRGDADPFAHPPHAAFHHIAHVEFAAHLPHIDRAALVGEGGIAGDDKKIADARQGGGDFLNHRVGKMRLLRVRREVFERQHRNRGPVAGLPALLRPGTGRCWQTAAATGHRDAR